MTKRRFFSITGFPLLIAVCAAAGIYFQEHILIFFNNAELFKERVSEAGIAAPFIFIGLQFLQVIFFVLPGEIPQIAGGYVFGALGGTALSLVGIMAGSSVNFFLGRGLGRPFVEAVLGNERTERFEGVIASEKAQTGFFLLFLIPGIPKDALCYVGGLSKIRFLPFFMISMLGRFPALFGSSLIGSAAAERNWPLLIMVSVVVVLIVGIGFLYREKLHSWIRRFQ